MCKRPVRLLLVHSVFCPLARPLVSAGAVRNLRVSLALWACAKDVGAGAMSVAGAQRGAAAARADGVSHEAVQHLSTCARERDLRRWVKGLHGGNVEPYFLKLQVEQTSQPGLHEELVPVLPVHEVFHSIRAAGVQQFAASFLGPDGLEGLANYWKHVLATPWGKSHPDLRGGADKAIPVTYHYDGAEMHRNVEFNVWSFSSATADGIASLDSKLLMMTVEAVRMKAASTKRGVHDEVCRYLAYCDRCLVSGTFPSHGFYGEDFPTNSWRYAKRGEPLAHGWIGVLVGLKMDWKAKVETHNLRCHYGSTHVCHACKALQCFKNCPDPRMNYADFSPSAPYMDTIISHGEYLVQEAGRLSPWCQLPSFRFEMIWDDWMHTGPLGIGRDIAASAIIDLLEGGLLQQNLAADDQLKLLWGEFKQWCRANGFKSPPGRFSTAMLGRSASTSFPELSSQFKAGGASDMHASQRQCLYACISTVRHLQHPCRCLMLQTLQRRC